MSGVDAVVVVVSDLLVDGLNELSNVVESPHIAELELEVAVKGLLVAVLPWTAFTAVRRGCAVICE